MKSVLVGGEHHGLILGIREHAHEVELPRSQPMGDLLFRGFATPAVFQTDIYTARRIACGGYESKRTYCAEKSMSDEAALSAVWDLLWDNTLTPPEPEQGQGGQGA